MKTRKYSPNPECEWCGGDGATYEDEYENGQCVGKGTLERPCPCTLGDDDEDFSGASEGDR